MGVCPARQLPVPPAPRRRNTPAQSARARLRWQQAVRRIRRLIKLRLIWNHLGIYLQQGWIQNTLLGIERVRGRVDRTQGAAQALQARIRRAAAKAAARNPRQ